MQYLQEDNIEVDTFAADFNSDIEEWSLTTHEVPTTSSTIHAKANRFADNPDDRDDEETLVKEVIGLVSNDNSPVLQVKIMDDEFDKIHFKDTYQTHRLNKDPDINDISVQQLISLLDSNETNYKPITSATIRAMKTKLIDIKLQFDSGANQSVTPHRKLQQNIKHIAPMSIDGVGGTVICFFKSIDNHLYTDS